MIIDAMNYRRRKTFTVANEADTRAMTNLRRIDLNLLVVLDALLREWHVTRAARNVGLSQPAMSSALARLRHLFDDELLVRTAAGMQPTPRAEALIEPIRQVLAQIERLLESDQAFDAKISSRRFVIRMSDFLGNLLLPLLMDRIGLTASHVFLDVVHLSPLQTCDALDRNEIDVAVSMGLEHATTIHSQKLFSDRMVCVMRRSHPLAKGKLSLQRFLEARHLKVSMSPSDIRFVDDVLAQANGRRDIALNVPHWLLVPQVVASTDCIAVMPETFASAIKEEALVQRPLPFASQPFDWCLYWHRRHQNDPANRWLRERIVEACRAYRP